MFNLEKKEFFFIKIKKPNFGQSRRRNRHGRRLALRVVIA